MGRPKGPVRDTRSLILARAFDLFSTAGYRAVTVKDIAAAVGIKDASLYNYFPSKQQLFDEVLGRERDYARTTLAAATKPFRATGKGPVADGGAFQDLVINAIEPLFADERLLVLRRLLTVTQFESEEAGQLYQELFIDLLHDYFRSLLDAVVAARVLDQCNTVTAAAELHGVLFVLLAQNKRWSEARPRAMAYIRAFERNHSS